MVLAIFTPLAPAWAKPRVIPAPSPPTNKFAVLTAFIVFFVSTLISVLLPNIVKKSKNKYCDYIVQPIYVDKNVYKIEFNCIIELKIVHIISIIYFLAKKGRSDKNERASNRRSYEYGYE